MIKLTTTTEIEEIEDISIDDLFTKKLIVHNDDHNSFDHVIYTLMSVCKHTLEQAEQCTLLIHHKGKAAVKEGSYDELKGMKQCIIDAGINATID